MQIMTELLEGIAGALDFYSRGDTNNAQATLRHCINLDVSQCDVWITKALVDGVVTDDLLTQIVATKNTFDLYFKQLDDRYARMIASRAPHLPLGFADLRAPVTTSRGIELANAASLVLKRQFARAEAALDNIPDSDSRLLRVWLYHCAGRYHLVLETVQPLTAQEGDDLYIYGRLFTGIAHAHLGNFDSARDHLLEILPNQTALTDAKAAAEAAYWAGLTYRQEQDEETARQYLQRAISIFHDDRFQNALDDTSVRIRVTKKELILRRSDPWDIGTEPSLQEVQEQEMSAKRGDLLSEGLAELNAMIGMTQLKEKIALHCNYVRGLQRREQLGMKADRAGTHIVFAGPPGTGKTTVAHVVAKIYAGLGIVKTDKLIKTSRADFVGKWSGWTADKTKEKLNEALDGVLFLDEAYALVADTGEGGSKDSFGSEAATEIVAFMEENRDRLVVIIAGYSDEIDRLLETNEGWSSRFTTRFEFESYDIHELLQMAKAWCAQKQFVLEPDAEEYILSMAKSLFTEHAVSGRRVIDNLGNGRFIRNLMETSTVWAIGHAMANSTSEEVNEGDLTGLTHTAVALAFDELTKRELGGKA